MQQLSTTSLKTDLSFNKIEEEAIENIKELLQAKLADITIAELKNLNLDFTTLLQDAKAAKAACVIICTESKPGYNHLYKTYSEFEEIYPISKSEHLKSIVDIIDKIIANNLPENTNIIERLKMVLNDASLINRIIRENRERKEQEQKKELEIQKTRKLEQQSANYALRFFTNDKYISRAIRDSSPLHKPITPKFDIFIRANYLAGFSAPAAALSDHKVAIGTANGIINVYDFNFGHNPRVISIPSQLTYSEDNYITHLVGRSFDTEIELFIATIKGKGVVVYDGSIQQSYWIQPPNEDKHNACTSIILLADNQHFAATYSRISGIYIYTIEGKFHSHIMPNIAFESLLDLPEGIFLGASNNIIYMFNPLLSAEPIAQLTGHVNSIDKLIKLTPNSFASIEEDTLKVWAVDSNACVGTYSNHEDQITKLSVPQTNSGSLKYAKPTHSYTNEPNTAIINPSSVAKDVWRPYEEIACAVSLPHHQLAIAYKNVIFFWRQETGKCEKVLVGNQERITHLAATPNGVVIAGDDTGKVFVCKPDDENFIHLVAIERPAAPNERSSNCSISYMNGADNETTVIFSDRSFLSFNPWQVFAENYLSILNQIETEFFEDLDLVTLLEFNSKDLDIKQLKIDLEKDISRLNNPAQYDVGFLAKLKQYKSDILPKLRKLAESVYEDEKKNYIEFLKGIENKLREEKFCLFISDKNIFKYGVEEAQEDISLQMKCLEKSTTVNFSLLKELKRYEGISEQLNNLEKEMQELLSSTAYGVKQI